MASQPVRAAVVGCGFQGRLHLECFAELEDAEVVAVCDRDPERLRAASDEFAVAAGFTAHDELLRSQPVDLLTICTMPDSHAEIARGAFAAGAGVLCEKPLAADLEGAFAIAEAAKRTGRYFSVGFNLRHSSAALAVKALVEESRLGVPVCARGSMLETEVPWWGPHQVSAISGGGAIASTAVHMIDLLMWLAGNPRPLTATASAARLFPRKRGSAVPEFANVDRYDVEDLAFGHVRFESGFWLTIEGAWTWDEPGWECRFDLVGDGGQASAPPLRVSAERSGELIDLTDGAEGDLDFPSSVQRELGAAVEAVRAGACSAETIEQAVEVQAVVDALYRSADEGREVEIADVRARLRAFDGGSRSATKAAAGSER